ncbi:MAG: G8 domain-containing protein [Natronospirillum sp.]|uniref:G8 domain-containing protein n=1 Tax=Natronospirillum sp. TaxID=2812955 RepID=UPI0025D9654A|nr:G8 domain-containing protein [Natronospirillum sp.]MCH8550975.1 G8 domain-containing protein [Natronospirillum sp.]
MNPGKSPVAPQHRNVTPLRIVLPMASLLLAGCIFGSSGGSSSNDSDDGSGTASSSLGQGDAEMITDVITRTFEGPGTLRFSWRLDADDADPSPNMAVHVNGSEVSRVEGSSDWQTRTFVVPEGEAEIEWHSEHVRWDDSEDRAQGHYARLNEVEFSAGVVERPAQVFPSGARYWSELYPSDAPNQDIMIGPNQVVIMDEPEVSIRSLMIHGQLLFQDQDAHLETHWIHVHGSNAKLELGTRERPLASDIRITFNDPRRVYRELLEEDEDAGLPRGQALWHVDADGEREARTDFGNYKTLMVMGGGTLSVYSESAMKRTWTQLDEPAEPGDTSLLLTSSTGWQPGDRIALAPTGFIATEAEDFTIESVQGRRIYLDRAVTYPRSGHVEYYRDGSDELRELDLRAEVALLSRNIVFEGDDSSVDHNYGVHTMYMYPSTVNISGLELRHCGQQGSQGRYCSHWHRPYVDNMEAIYARAEFKAMWDRYEGPGKPDEMPSTNVERWRLYTVNNNGRNMYVQLGEDDRQQMDQWLIDSIDATGDYIRNSSVHSSFQRAVNLHGTTGVVVDNNVGYDISNHAFVFAEDGTEFGNTLSRNLAMLVHNVLDPEKTAFLRRQIRVPGTDQRASPCFERRAVTIPQTSSCQEEDKVGAFWGENPFNTLRGNVAAGVTERGTGFFNSAAFVGRARWDDERGLYRMYSGNSNQNQASAMWPRDWEDWEIVAPAPMIFEDNRAHTISWVDGEVARGPADGNIYPPQTRGMGFFFRGFRGDGAAIGPGDFVLRNIQAYGLQDHGVWIENDQIVDGCVIASSYKRAIVLTGSNDNSGVRNCALVGDAESPQLQRSGNDVRNMFYAFAPNYGRSSDSFHPFIHDTVIYNHAGGLLTPSGPGMNEDSLMDVRNVDVVE